MTTREQSSLKSLDLVFHSLSRLRQELTEVTRNLPDASLEASRLYVGIDFLARDTLVFGISKIWNVPAEDRRRAVRERTLPVLVRVAEEHAPVGVSREILGRIQTLFHHLRNRIEHHGHQVNVGTCFEYLEAVETIAHTIAEPSIPDPPQGQFESLPGFELLGVHTLVKGQADHPWSVVHSGKVLPYGSQHLLEFWRFEENWKMVWMADLGQANVARVERIETRSPLDQEIVAWRRFGESMGVMSYDIFGVEGSNVIRLLSRQSVSGAYLMVRGSVVEEVAGDRVTRYEWDGNAYVGHRVVRHPPAPASFTDLHYAVVDGAVVGPQELKVRVGQMFRLLRDDLDPAVVRVLFSATGAIEQFEYGYRAMRPGETQISPIPDVYDWDHALRIQVTVTDA